MPTESKTRWIASLLADSAAHAPALPWQRGPKRARRTAQLQTVVPFVHTLRTGPAPRHGLAHS